MRICFNVGHLSMVFLLVGCGKSDQQAHSPALAADASKAVQVQQVDKTSTERIYEESRSSLEPVLKATIDELSARSSSGVIYRLLAPVYKEMLRQQDFDSMWQSEAILGEEPARNGGTVQIKSLGVNFMEPTALMSGGSIVQAEAALKVVVKKPSRPPEEHSAYVVFARQTGGSWVITDVKGKLPPSQLLRGTRLQMLLKTKQ